MVAKCDSRIGCLTSTAKFLSMIATLTRMVRDVGINVLANLIANTVTAAAIYVVGLGVDIFPYKPILFELSVVVLAFAALLVMAKGLSLAMISSKSGPDADSTIHRHTAGALLLLAAALVEVYFWLRSQGVNLPVLLKSGVGGVICAGILWILSRLLARRALKPPLAVKPPFAARYDEGDGY